jgi:hypothetical protein
MDTLAIVATVPAEKVRLCWLYSGGRCQPRVGGAICPRWRKRYESLRIPGWICLLGALNWQY